MTRFVYIKKSGYSYGFELKSEANPYRKYAVISKISLDSKNELQISVGDRVVSINDEVVDGKYYMAVRNIIRSSPDNWCKLEILENSEKEVLNEIIDVETRSSFKNRNSRILINSQSEPNIHTESLLDYPSGMTKERIKLFQNNSENLIINEKNLLSSPISSSSSSLVNATISQGHSTNQQPINNSFFFKRSRSRSYDIDMKSKISLFSSNKIISHSFNSHTKLKHNRNNLNSTNRCSQSCTCLINDDLIEISNTNSNDNIVYEQDPKNDESLEVSNIVVSNDIYPILEPLKIPETINSNKDNSTSLLSPVLISQPLDDVVIPIQQVPKIDIGQYNLQSINIGISTTTIATTTTTTATTSPSSLSSPQCQYTSSLSSQPNLNLLPISDNNALPSLVVSKSSCNLLDDSTTPDEKVPTFLYKSPTFSSMRDITCQNTEDQSLAKSLKKQDSIIQSIPIKLKIMQYYEKKSKNWRDYAIEEEKDGVRFRTRSNNTRKPQKYWDFIIARKEVSQFEPIIESTSSSSTSLVYKKFPTQTRWHTQIKSESTDSSITMTTRYLLSADQKNIQLKLYFNNSVFHDDQAIKNAYEQYQRIIDKLNIGKTQSDQLSVFTGGLSTQDLKKDSISEEPCNTCNIACSCDRLSLESHDSLNNSATHSPYITASKKDQPKLSVDNSVSDSKVNMMTSVNEKRKVSHSTSHRSGSKSSCENISNFDNLQTTNSSSTAGITGNSSKSLISKVKDLIKIDEKKSNTSGKTIQVFTGTKQEYEEFRKQLEKGEMPLEMDLTDENGSHFSKYLHEVPRMTNLPNFPKVPMIVYICVQIVEKIGLSKEGIYRRPGNQRVVKSLMSNINKPLSEIDAESNDWNNVYAVCALLKLFLRKLKEYLIPSNLSPFLAYSSKTVDSSDPESLAKALMDIRYHLSSHKPLKSEISKELGKNADEIATIIEDQFECHSQTLQYLLAHLNKVSANQKQNLMNEHALAMCFTPVVMEAWQTNIADVKANNDFMTKAVELMIIHQKWLFNDWNPDFDRTRCLQLMEGALQYSQDFVNNKTIKIDPNIPINPDKEIEDIRHIVRNAKDQVALRSYEKKIPSRRHSSHTVYIPSLQDEEDNKTLSSSNNLFFNVQNENFIGNRNVSLRSSQTTDALDLPYYVSLMRHVSRISGIGDTKITSPVISKRENSFPNHKDVRKPSVVLDIVPDKLDEDSDLIQDLPGTKNGRGIFSKL